tara:strand:- start:7098 stop:7589 length:492 start_codon:yes stop_codon:yes gene_type:complete
MALTKLNNQSLAAVTSAGIPIRSGSVLQVVQGTTQTQVTMTNTYADMGLSVNITPKTSNSDIFILVNSQIYIAANGYGTRLLRDSTVIFTAAGSDSNGPFEGYGSSMHHRTGYNFLDIGRSAGTSQITYKLQGRRYHSSSNIQYNYNDVTDATSVIQAIEIAA